LQICCCQYKQRGCPACRLICFLEAEQLSACYSVFTEAEAGQIFARNIEFVIAVRAQLL
jgi:hypothetical protein